MNQNLKRIETTLHQLPKVSAASYPPATTRKVQASLSKTCTYSFEISNTPQQQIDAPQPSLGEGKLLQSSAELQPVQQSPKKPTLPELNSHFNSFNPALKNLPQQTDVTVIKAHLQKIVCQIQDIYLEGPMVDGWLEAYPRPTEPKTLVRRDEPVEHLMKYVKEVYSFEQGQVICEFPRPGYRLCGLDAAGQKWTRPCPLDQLASVSIAIARYQKLQHLLESKQHLERRLANAKSPISS